MRDELKSRKSTLGDIIADKTTYFVGSWKFLIIQTFIFGGWIFYNFVISENPFDPYPFILLTLVLSLEAIYLTPLIMMSQNRQANKDRLRDDADYSADMQSEKNIEKVLKEITALNEKIDKLKRE